MATNVQLSPELEEFARTLVETGHYTTVDEVVSSGLRLLQDQTRRKDFAAMIAEVRAETERSGTVTMEEVAAELDAILAEAEASGQLSVSSPAE